MDLGPVLRAARVEARLSQQAVADAVGVTRETLGRWESGARPVRSDDADNVLAACGRDVRWRLVDRHADVDDILARLAAMPAEGRLRELRGVLLLDRLHALQATGVVVFTAAWAAAALGLPALHTAGGLLVSDDASEQAKVAAILKAFNPQSLAPGGPWGVTWNDTVFEHYPAERWVTSLLGEFTTEVVADVGLELRVATEDVSWRVVEPGRLVPEFVDADVLQRWRARRAT